MNLQKEQMAGGKAQSRVIVGLVWEEAPFPRRRVCLRRLRKVPLHLGSLQWAEGPGKCFEQSRQDRSYFRAGCSMSGSNYGMDGEGREES